MTNEELVGFIKKNPLSVGCAVLCFGLGAALYFRSAELPAAEEELTQKTKQADRLTANITNATELKEHLEALVAANKEIDTRIIRASQLAVNYQFFYKIISESGVKQIDLRWSPPGAAPKGGKNAFIPVSFNVAVQGELPQIIHFLRLLESGARYARVLTAAANVPANDRTGPITLSLNLELLGVP